MARISSKIYIINKNIAIMASESHEFPYDTRLILDQSVSQPTKLRESLQFACLLTGPQGGTEQATGSNQSSFSSHSGVKKV